MENPRGYYPCDKRDNGQAYQETKTRKTSFYIEGRLIPSHVLEKKI